MSNKVDRHLNEDQISVAVIDAKDLTGVEQAHLSRCQQCRDRVGRIREDLRRIGRCAQTYAPEPHRPVSLPSGKTIRRNRYRGFGLVPAAIAVGLLILAIWWTGLVNVGVESPDPKLSSIEQTTDSDFETPLLTDSALPDVFLEMIGEDESDFNEDFMEFVVPDPELEDDSISGKRKDSYHV